MSSLPQGFPDFLILRVELQRLLERISSTFVVLRTLREYQYHERAVYIEVK
jgi:hypothetical protein